MTAQTILVTGARGTVGHYVAALAEAQGYRVLANDLTPKGLAQPVRGELRAGDVRDPTVAARLVRGADFVVHTAALLEASEPGQLTQTNTDAVVTLYQAAREAGVKRFVHMSTAMLYETGTATARTETDGLHPRGPHGMSKHAAELFLREQDTGPEWCILRAAPIYGRRGRHFASALLSVGPFLRLGMPFVPRFSGGPRATFVHAEDVARALMFLLKHPKAAREVYNVSDDNPLGFGDRLAETYRAYGLRTFSAGEWPTRAARELVKFVQAPEAHRSLDAGAVAAWRLVVLRHGLLPQLTPKLDPEAAALLYSDLVVDSAKLRALGYSVRFPNFADGWRDVLRWYQAERWVPRYS